MDHALPSRIEWPWHYVGIVVYLAINLWLIAIVFLTFTFPADWEVISQTPAAYLRGDLYERPRPWEPPVPFIWSPLVAGIMAPLAPLGYVAWTGLHIAALALLRQRLLIILAMLSAGFWADVLLGNTVVFVFVAGALALNGSRPATLVYIGLCALMPRPLQLPLLVWVLWQRPEVRLPAIGIFAVHAAGVLLTGYVDEWTNALLTQAGGTFSTSINWGPTRWLGIAWLVVGVPLAGVFTWRGYVGLAGLALSPYVFPQYLLFVLLVGGTTRSVRKFEPSLLPQPSTGAGH